jgi:hypothetical protein
VGGTVTSIDVSGGTTGLTTSGGPVTTSGTITLAGTLAVANGGTGVTSSTGTGSVVLSTNPTFAGLTTTADMNFGDSDKAIFGAGNDLEIYHDGSSSFISDQGAGSLRILAQNFVLADPTNTEAMIVAFPNSSVDLYYDNAKKFETTATGIDVTGTVVSDAIQVDTDSGITLKDGGDSRTLTFKIDAGTGRYQASGSADHFFTTTDSNLARFYIANNGDISFYEDTGTTPKFFWDASAESLGIGTTSPAYLVDAYGAVASRGSGTGNAAFVLQEVGNDPWYLMQFTGGAVSINYSATSSANSKFLIDTSGNVGIGTSSPSANLHIANSGVPTIRLEDSGSSQYAQIFTNNDDLVIGSDEGNTGSLSSIAFRVDASEKMRIDTSGNVGIGTSSPSSVLHVSDTTQPQITMQDSTNSSFGRITGGGTTGSLTLEADYTNTKAGTVMTFNVDNTERMRIDSSGNVGIGTSSPAAKLDVAETDNVTYSSSSVQGDLIISRKNSANTVNQVVGLEFDITGWSGSTTGVAGISAIQTGSNQSSAALAFQTRNSGTVAERMRIDSSGNVGIGTSSPTAKLHVGAVSNIVGNLSPTAVIIGDINTSGSEETTLGIYQGGTSVGSAVGLVAGVTSGASPYFAIKTRPTAGGDSIERLRIDSSGNLLVGKTVQGIATSGVELTPNDRAAFTKSGGAPILVNRTSNDGEIINLRKDGTTVGSIGSNNSDLYIAKAGYAGLRFGDAAVKPASDLGTHQDNLYDLGVSTVRWKDLYLSGGVYLGGTVAANKLDDYETGTFTPTLSFGGGNTGLVYVTLTIRLSDGRHRPE